MAAAEEILDLLGHFSQSRLRFEHPGQFRRVFALPHRHAVSVLLPRRANVVAMAEQAFVAVHEFRDRLADVIAAPACSAPDLDRSRRCGARERRARTRRLPATLPPGSALSGSAIPGSAG